MINNKINRIGFLCIIKKDDGLGEDGLREISIT